MLLATLSAVSAGLLTLAAPPFNLGWVAWLALIPFFWALLRIPTAGFQRPWLAAAGLGFLHGFVYLWTLVPWFGAFTPAGYPVAALYWGLLSAAVSALAVRLLQRREPGWGPAILACGWLALEWLRAQGVLAFPWGTLAATQYRQLPMLQMLDLTGSYGLSLLMALTAASAAALLAGGSGAVAVRWTVASVVVAAGFWLRGAYLLGPPATGQPVRVAIIQSSESRKTEGAEVVCVSPLEEYEARTREALKERPDLVVWPETACTADVVNTPVIRSRMVNLLSKSGAHLLTGSFVVDPPSGQTANAAAMLSPQARILGQYAKVLIVPFGEYLPARPLLGWTTGLGMPETDLKPGAGFTPLSWDKGAVGVSICFESAFGGVSRQMVGKGANLMAILTSDGWNGRRSAGLQHAMFAPLRAVEERRSVVRAAATGVSQAIDPYGRVLKSLPMFEKGYLVAELPLRTERTFYSYAGDWPVLAALGVLVAAALGRKRRSPLQESEVRV